jgi:hypothetical protein
MWGVRYSADLKNPIYVNISVLKPNIDEQIRNLVKYIRKYEPMYEYTKAQKEDSVLRELISWAFNHFVYQRLQSVKNIYEACQEYKDSEQFMDVIVRYLAREEENETLLTNPADYKVWFKLLKEKPMIELKSIIARYLESDDKLVSLNFISGIIRLLTDDYDNADGERRLKMAFEEISRFATNEITEIVREMFNVILGISQYDVDSALALQEKPKKRMFRKEELNNKEGLFNVFVGLLTINGLKSYIEFMYGNGKDTINLNETFEVYFTKKYGEGTMYVDPNKFINNFRDDVIAYYIEKIEEIINKINVLNVKINSNTYLMCGNIRVGMNQAVLQRDIREQYPAKRDELMIVGFTMDELNRIYTDLKEFVGNGFSFGTDDEELFLRKV